MTTKKESEMLSRGQSKRKRDDETDCEAREVKRLDLQRKVTFMSLEENEERRLY
jgi:hypothetical protein